MFGLPGGTVLTFIGAVLAAAFNYLLAGNLLRSRIKKIVEARPGIELDYVCPGIAKMVK
jgi:uncharacterized membrane protein YdjX (TVP38/TMEM64 family)